MATERITQGSRYWPEGLDDVGAAGPGMVFVRGNRELLERQAVLLDGTPHASPRGVAVASEISRGIANTDVAIVGDFENPAARMAVLAAAKEGGAAVLYSRFPLNTVEDRDLQYLAAQIIEHGGAVASFSPDSGEPLEEDAYRRALAAHATVVFVAEADGDYRSTQVAEYADKLGRAVAVIAPPAERSHRYAGNTELITHNRAQGVESSRDVLELVGPAPRTANDELMGTLDRLEFSRRVGHLLEGGRIDQQAVGNLLDMASESKDLTEFQARMHYGGSRMLGAVEYRYLMTTLETPEGQRPQTWSESETYVRAFGFDRYQTVTQQAQMERDREHLPSMAAH